MQQLEANRQSTLAELKQEKDRVKELEAKIAELETRVGELTEKEADLTLELKVGVDES